MCLSPKSRIVMQWSPPCSDLARFFCLYVWRGVRTSSASVPVSLCSVNSAACFMGHALGLSAVVRTRRWLGIRNGATSFIRCFFFQPQNSCLINGWCMSQLGKGSWSYFVTLCVIKTLSYFFIKKRSWQTVLNVCLRTKRTEFCR